VPWPRAGVEDRSTEELEFRRRVIVLQAFINTGRLFDVPRSRPLSGEGFSVGAALGRHVSGH
jgi:hypothetical protein